MEKGFTLVEVLIYLGLLSVIFVSVYEASLEIFESSGRLQSLVLIQEEGDFLVEKFDWGLNNAQSFSITSLPQTLSIYKNNYSDNPVVFEINNGGITLSESTNTSEFLNNSQLKVSNLIFLDMPAASSSPEGIKINFTMNALTPEGIKVSRDFTLTKYLLR